MLNWIYFAGAGVLWGSSFLWIKIALREVIPAVVVLGRVFFGFCGLFLLMKYFKLKFPQSKKTRIDLAIVSLFSPTLPMLLISWSETRIDSGIASVLNATVPFFTMFFAHVLLGTEERMTVKKTFGIFLGFIGVTLLILKDFHLSSLTQGKEWLGQCAVLLASAFYSISVIYSRKKMRGISPIVQSASIMGYGAISCFFMVLFQWLTGRADVFQIIPTHGITWFALLWLGLLGSCLAFICFYTLLEKWGATRASLVSYIYPLVGFILGAIVLKEPINSQVWVGAFFIFSGVGLVSLKK